MRNNIYAVVGIHRHSYRPLPSLAPTETTQKHTGNFNAIAYAQIEAEKNLLVT